MTRERALWSVVAMIVLFGVLLGYVAGCGAFRLRCQELTIGLGDAGAAR